MTNDQPPVPVCPYARPIAGTTNLEAGVVCRVMEQDAARADPILEGAPCGVILRWRTDPNMLRNLCCGTGDPVVSPDELRHREQGDGHYTGCPIYAAGREIEFATAEHERAFPRLDRPDLDDKSALGPAVQLDDFEIEMGS